MGRLAISAGSTNPTSLISAAIAPGARDVASRAAVAKSRADRIFNLIISSNALEALTDSKARVRSIISFGKIDADGPQPQLRHVESYSEAGVTVERPIRWIPRDSIGVRIEQRAGSSNS